MLIAEAVLAVKDERHVDRTIPGITAIFRDFHRLPPGSDNTIFLSVTAATVSDYRAMRKLQVTL